jgi:lipase chaperone LimK
MCFSDTGSCDQLAEAAIHFARAKITKQAKMLVERQRKFEQQLISAEEQQQQQLQLLEHTPVEQRSALVQQMRAAVQQMAQGVWPLQQTRLTDISMHFTMCTPHFNSAISNLSCTCA